MKRAILSGICFCLAMGIAVAQDYAAGEDFFRKKIYVDAYYGFPNLWRSILKASLNSSGSNNRIDYTSIGPIGGRIEYQAHKVVGILIEAYYANDILESTEPNPSAPGGYAYERLEIVRPRVIGRINFHFVDDKEVDPYAFFGAGWNGSQFKYTSNYYPGTSLDYSITNMAVKLGLGIRYFFIPSLGANFEISLGGPLVMLGISGRF